jgi:hypothetical protein
VNRGTVVSELSGRTTVVVGASRGLRRGIARAFAEADAPVVAVARTGAALAELATTSVNIHTEVRGCDRRIGGVEPAGRLRAGGSHPGRRREPCDASAPGPDWGDVLRQLAYRRQDRVHLGARGTAEAAAARQQGGGSSSGAALNGSPASGGYAGSKATQRFIAAYAQDESRRAGLDITVTAVLPRMTPFGDVGRRGVRAYAARDGQTEEAYLQQLGELLTPEIAGSALVDLVLADPAVTAPEYVLTAAGLQQLP